VTTILLNKTPRLPQNKNSIRKIKLKEWLFKDLINSLISISRNKFNYLFLFFQIVILSGCIEQLNNNLTLLVNFLICIILCVFNKRLRLSVLFVSLIAALILAIIPSILFGIESYRTLVGFFMRIAIASMIVLYLRLEFFLFFENLVFILALISLPLYLIQIIDIKFYEIFKHFSELVLSQVRLTQGFGVLSGHRYLVVFLVNSWAENRNSGFGWEPAVFGAILCWAIFINLFLHKNTLNFKLLILFLAAITTFSIGTYIALLIIYSFFILNQKRKTLFIIYGIITFLIVSSLSFYNETEERLDRYVLNTKKQVYLKYNQGNRFDAIFFGFESLVKRPLGYGIRNTPLEKIRFPNGFIVIILQFGYLGIITIIYLLIKLYYVLQRISMTKFKGIILFILTIIVTLNGNPMSYQEIMFAFILSGYTFSKIVKKELKKQD
jgi:hypothetical protein